MTDAEEAARRALRERQGAGARYDAPAAPARALGWARRGAAYFSRILNGLPDEALASSSLVPGWTRAHVVAHIGYNARALARIVEWARTGVAHPMYESAQARADEIALGATLPPRALRTLFQHAEVHLNVEWRDLDETGWAMVAGHAVTPPLPVRDTPWLRAREIWLHAVDIGHDASYQDMPPEFLDRLLPELFESSGIEAQIAPTDRSFMLGAGRRIEGKAADLARWLAGRGARRVAGDLPHAPPIRDEG